MVMVRAWWATCWPGRCRSGLPQWFHAQALQRDQHFLPSSPGTEQHDFGGVGDRGVPRVVMRRGLQTVDVKTIRASLNMGRPGWFACCAKPENLLRLSQSASTGFAARRTIAP